MSKQQSQSIKGKVVVLTGASSGIGRGTALEFARQGACLVLAARRGEVLDQLVRECEGHGAEALAVQTDVGSQGDMEALLNEAILRFGRIDVWVNDAGVAAVGRFDQVPIADHVRVLQTDLLGTMYGSWYAMKQFRQQGQGILINIASALGKIPAPYYASYTAAKSGIVAFDAALRQELMVTNCKNIHVCTVVPMAMDTPFFEHAANYSGHQTAPVPPLYSADRVIETIVALATAPQDEVIVGTAGRIAVLAHNLAPSLTERLMALQTHYTQMKHAPVSGTTQGAVKQPMAKGTEVHSEQPHEVLTQPNRGKRGNGSARAN